MILQALYQHYNTLVDQGILTRPGWDAAFKVSYALELDDSGALINIIDLRTEQVWGEKTSMEPRPMCVPAHKGRSGRTPQSYFLCDNSRYLLGVDKDQQDTLRFRLCVDLHRKILQNTDSPAAHAILRFFDNWDTQSALSHPQIAPRAKELTNGSNLIFFYDSRAVTEDPLIRSAYQHYYEETSSDAPQGRCLITGELGPIEKTHPKIRGILPLGEKAEVGLVTFNADAFCSYGHTQSFNAPVSSVAAYAYTSALSHLLADSAHRVDIGNTAVVCWAEHGDTAYVDAARWMLFGPQQGKVQDDELAGLLRSLIQGEPLQWHDRQLDPGEHFYFLGLSPNAARLSVRFFLQDTFGSFAQHIRQHYADTAIVRPTFDQKETLAAWQLVNETVNQKSRDKKPSPQLAGDLLRAILTGTRYPATLLNGVQLRIRAEHKVTRGRAAIIKGYYLRSNAPCEKEVFTVELNEQSTYQPYLLGRLFSVLEALQESANPGISATIRDKYFNSASATPASIFPLLLNLGQKHLRKLSPQQRTWYDKQITELLGQMGQTYPPRMTLQEQGAFQIGYYHQTQKRYSKKEEK